MDQADPQSAPMTVTFSCPPELEAVHGEDPELLGKDRAA